MVFVEKSTRELRDLLASMPAYNQTEYHKGIVATVCWMLGESDKPDVQPVHSEDM